MLSLWANWLQLNSQLNSWSLSYDLYCTSLTSNQATNKKNKIKLKDTFLLLQKLCQFSIYGAEVSSYIIPTSLTSKQANLNPPPITTPAYNYCKSGNIRGTLIFAYFAQNSARANSKTRENICDILYAHFKHVGIVYWACVLTQMGNILESVWDLLCFCAAQLHTYL